MKVSKTDGDIILARAPRQASLRASNKVRGQAMIGCYDDQMILLSSIEFNYYCSVVPAVAKGIDLNS